jgi:hypothetical protein
MKTAQRFQQKKTHFLIVLTILASGSKNQIKAKIFLNRTIDQQ